MAHYYEEAIPAEIRNLTDAEAVEKFAAGASMPARAINGLSKEQLNSFPVPGTWSIQQIVVHLLDSDLMASSRMKRIIAEDHPRLETYDETAFSQRLGYDKLSAQAAAEVFRLHRMLTADLLRHASPDAFKRTADHPEIGELSLGQLVRIYAHHVDHHMVFVQKKRKLLGAPPA
jgi:uncharacterized damage-inducible protein DinB